MSGRFRFKRNLCGRRSIISIQISEESKECFMKTGAVVETESSMG